MYADQTIAQRHDAGLRYFALPRISAEWWLSAKGSRLMSISEMYRERQTLSKLALNAHF